MGPTTAVWMQTDGLPRGRVTVRAASPNSSDVVAVGELLGGERAMAVWVIRYAAGVLVDGLERMTLSNPVTAVISPVAATSNVAAAVMMTRGPLALELG